MRPVIHRWILSNGITFLYQSNPSVPLAAGTLLLRTGSLYEPAAQAGLTNLTVEMLLQGTQSRSAAQIAAEIESIGGSIGTQTTDDYVEVGWLAPATHLRPVLDVLLEILIAPTFPLKEISKERAQILSSLASRYDTLFNVVHDRFDQLLFGNHPYGRLVEGGADTVKRFTRHDLVRWHRRHFQPSSGIVSVVAPLPARAARILLLRYFERWKPSSRLSEAQPSPPNPLRADKIHRSKAPFEQAFLMTGMTAPAVGQPGYAALKVLNMIFGGGMSSRLFLELREKMGLAYDVSSFFPSRIQGSQWSLYMGLPPEKVALARKKMNDMLQQLASRGVTPAEVKQAKAMLKGSFLLESQTRRRQAWYAAWSEFLGHGPYFADHFIKEIDAVHPSDIKGLARKLLNQPRVTVEVVPQ